MVSVYHSSEEGAVSASTNLKKSEVLKMEEKEIILVISCVLSEKM